MKPLLTIFLLAWAIPLYSQTLVIDRNHLWAVNQNAAMRYMSELGYQESLNAIRQNTDDIGVNMAGLAMVETIIFKSLTEVNGVFKDAIRIKQIGRIIQDIYSLCDQSMEIASQNPMLLLFAETYIKQSKERSLNLAAEVSGFILQEGNNILINPNLRDELLGKISMELQLISSYTLAVRNSMYWANVNGILQKVNPYQADINRDLNLVDQILFQKKTILK